MAVFLTHMLVVKRIVRRLQFLVFEPSARGRSVRVDTASLGLRELDGRPFGVV